MSNLYIIIGLAFAVTLDTDSLYAVKQNVENLEFTATLFLTMFFYYLYQHYYY